MHDIPLLIGVPWDEQFIDIGNSYVDVDFYYFVYGYLLFTCYWAVRMVSLERSISETISEESSILFPVFTLTLHFNYDLSQSSCCYDVDSFSFISVFFFLSVISHLKSFYSIPFI